VRWQSCGDWRWFLNEVAPIETWRRQPAKTHEIAEMAQDVFDWDWRMLRDKGS